MARKQRADITDDQFKQAIEWLENGGTKKGACEILNVGNNKTMETRIEEWKQAKETEKRMRREKRKTAITPEEKAMIIEDYLDGATFDELSKRFYRSTAYIQHMLWLAGALIRHRGERNPLDPPLLPEECVLLEPDFRTREEVCFEAASLNDFESKRKQILAEKGWSSGEVVDIKTIKKWNPKCAVQRKGELVWVPGYQCMGEIVKEVPCKQAKAYRIFLLDQDHHQYINLPYWDIGSLRHLVDLGVDITSRGSFLRAADCMEALNETIKKARKQK